MINNKLGYVFFGNPGEIYFNQETEDYFIYLNNIKLYLQNNNVYDSIRYEILSRDLSKPSEQAIITRNLDDLELYEQKDNYVIYKISNLNGLIGLNSVSFINSNNPSDVNNSGTYILQSMATNGYDFIWGDGFSGLEGDKENNWRWSDRESKLKIINSLNTKKLITIKMGIATGYEEKSALFINNDSFKDIAYINIGGYQYSANILLEPGVNILNFLSEAKKIEAPNDPRELYFKVLNFSSEEIK